jgi:predicted small secreted protein
MSNNMPENEKAENMSQSNTDTVGNNQNMDDSEKMVNLVDSSKVQVMSENGKYLIDVDIENLDEGKYYRVDYQGDVYGIEKLDDGQLVFYEVMD